MDGEILKRTVNSKYGTFIFELVDYPGPSPLTDISFNGEHLGWGDFINLSTATEMELLELAVNIKYPADDYDY